MTPDWLFQVMWFGASVGATGAIWYFLSQRNYHAVLWWGFATAIVILLAVTLHIRNDLLRSE
jgi:cell division protein FtsW (lipid II flippase)